MAETSIWKITPTVKSLTYLITGNQYLNKVALLNISPGRNLFALAQLLPDESGVNWVVDVYLIDSDDPGDLNDYRLIYRTEYLNKINKIQIIQYADKMYRLVVSTGLETDNTAGPSQVIVYNINTSVM